MLLVVNSFEIFSKHKGNFFILESFALNSYISAALTNKKLLLPLQCSLKQNFMSGFVKLIEYWGSAVNVWFNPCVGPLPRIKIFFLYYQCPQMSSYQLQK